MVHSIAGLTYSIAKHVIIVRRRNDLIYSENPISFVAWDLLVSIIFNNCRLLCTHDVFGFKEYHII